MMKYSIHTLRKKWFSPFLILLAMLNCSCDEDDMVKIVFTGDSEIARWDLQAYFPTEVTCNEGKSGSGLEHLQGQAGKFKGQTVVVLCGTNDLHKLGSEEAIEKYAADYVCAVSATGGSNIYAISVLPRAKEGDDEDMNRRVVALNLAIKAEIAKADDPRIMWVDVHELFLNDKGELDANLTYDGLHLNYLGYQLLANELNRYFL